MRPRKVCDKGFIGVVVEMITQIVDRADRNDSVKDYCEKSKNSLLFAKHRCARCRMGALRFDLGEGDEHEAID